MLADPLGGLGHELRTSTCVFPSALLFLCAPARAAGIASMDRRESVYPLVECVSDCRGCCKAARIGNQESRGVETAAVTSSPNTELVRL